MPLNKATKIIIRDEMNGLRVTSGFVKDEDHRSFMMMIASVVKDDAAFKSYKRFLEQDNFTLILRKIVRELYKDQKILDSEKMIPVQHTELVRLFNNIIAKDKVLKSDKVKDLLRYLVSMVFYKANLLSSHYQLVEVKYEDDSLPTEDDIKSDIYASIIWKVYKGIKIGKPYPSAKGRYGTTETLADSMAQGLNDILSDIYMVERINESFKVVNTVLQRYLSREGSGTFEYKEYCDKMLEYANFAYFAAKFERPSGQNPAPYIVHTAFDNVTTWLNNKLTFHKIISKDEFIKFIDHAKYRVQSSNHIVITKFNRRIDADISHLVHCTFFNHLGKQDQISINKIPIMDDVVKHVCRSFQEFSNYVIDDFGYIFPDYYYDPHALTDRLKRISKEGSAKDVGFDKDNAALSSEMIEMTIDSLKPVILMPMKGNIKDNILAYWILLHSNSVTSATGDGGDIHLKFHFNQETLPESQKIYLIEQANKCFKRDPHDDKGIRKLYHKVKYDGTRVELVIRARDLDFFIDGHPVFRWLLVMIETVDHKGSYPVGKLSLDTVSGHKYMFLQKPQYLPYSTCVLKQPINFAGLNCEINFPLKELHSTSEDLLLLYSPVLNMVRNDTMSFLDEYDLRLNRKESSHNLVKSAIIKNVIKYVDTCSSHPQIKEWADLIDSEFTSPEVASLGFLSWNNRVRRKAIYVLLTCFLLDFFAASPNKGNGNKGGIELKFTNYVIKTITDDISYTHWYDFLNSIDPLHL